MRRTLMLAVVVVVGTLWPPSASAQAAPGKFQELRNAGRLETDDSFIVTRTDGTLVKGKLQQVVSGNLRLLVRGDLLELSEAEVERIEHRDRADDGAVLGALAGAGVLRAWAHWACGEDAEACGNAVLFVGPTLLLGGGVVGYLVDHAKRRVVFDATSARETRLTVKPVVSRHHRGAAVSIAW